jgi:phospholipid/cholesterol/gamma-HCH transport system permease protein
LSHSQTDLLSAERSGDTLSVTLRGQWHIDERPPDVTDTLAAPFKDGGPPAQVSFLATELGLYDSSLISVLLQLHRQCEKAGASFDRESLPSGVNDLLDMALAVPETEDARAGVTEISFLFRLGTASIQFVDEFLDLFNFLGECIFSFGRLLAGRARFRRKDFWLILQECGAEALPIVSLISGLIGMILAFVGAHQLGSMGATIFVADLVAVAMVREMGAIMTGIIMSGRTGAAFAAQLGSMKVNEEIDALRTFGFNPIDYLVLPRMLALIVMMPLLTVYANVVGIAGGMLVGLATDLSFEQYFNQTINSLDLVSCSIGIGKSVTFGIIISAAGCLRGMQSGSSSSAVGTAATSAVVTSITAIIVADAIFAVVTTILGI